jgi:hypothetical protein
MTVDLTDICLPPLSRVASVAYTRLENVVQVAHVDMVNLQ